MIENSSRKIVLFFSQKGLIQNEQCEWCIYALVSRISLIISIFFMILFGMLFTAPFNVICFLFGILPLRKRLGGYHAKNPFACVFLSVAVMLLSLLCVNITIYYRIEWAIHILLALSSITIWLSKPYGHKNMHLTQEELVQNKVKVKNILMIELSLIVLLCFLFSQNKGFLFCEIGIIAAALSFIFDPKI